MPPDRDVRVWAKLMRVMFCTPGFLALLLLQAGEPTGFGITVEPLVFYQLADSGTFSHGVSKPLNRAINIGILVLTADRQFRDRGEQPLGVFRLRFVENLVRRP